MKYLLALLLTLLLNSAFAQHDATWLLGGSSAYSQRGSRLDFKGDSLQVEPFLLPFAYEQIGGLAMSDEDGRLLFYTNSCQIRNAQHQPMAGSVGFQEEGRLTGYCGARLGAYPLTQGLLALPLAGTDDHYLLFHLRMDEAGRLTDLLYTRINMSAEEGRGRVVEQNILILQDALVDQLTAVRHCNGEDWWVLVPGHQSNGYYRIFVSSDWVGGPQHQSIGQAWNAEDANGQAVFSPNGQYYLRTSARNGLSCFSFDACTGLLSEPVAIPSDGDDGLAAGVSVGPDSRFVYQSYSRVLYQYDLWAEDFFASRQLIDEYDGFRSPYPTTFFQHRLAPDGRIYLSSSNRVDYLHVITNPSEKGKACNFEQHAVQLPAPHRFALPNFPVFTPSRASTSPPVTSHQ